MNKTLTEKILKKFEKTMQFYHPQDLDGHQHWIDFLEEVYLEGKKSTISQTRQELIEEIKNIDRVGAIKTTNGRIIKTDHIDLIKRQDVLNNLTTK